MAASPRAPIEPFDCLVQGLRLAGRHYVLFLALVFVAQILSIPLLILYGAMLCGLHLCFAAALEGVRPGFGLLLDGLAFFRPSFVAVWLFFLPLFAIGLGLALALTFADTTYDPGALEEESAAASLVLAVVWTCAQVVVFVACALIVDHGLGGVAALGASLGAIRASFGGVVALALLLAGATALAAELSVVLPLLLGPFALAPMEIAYRKMFFVERGG